MKNVSDSLENLINELNKLPQIGRKTAQRLAMYIIRKPVEEVERLSNALLEVKRKIRLCEICCNITEEPKCKICTSPSRDKSIICVVEEPQDVYAIERTNEYKGLFHVLHGRISPLEGIGPNDIKVKELIYRLDDNQVKEIILALNPTVEGETTVLYLTKLIKPLGIKITRIARGVPVGSDLELADELTLAKAIEGRITVE